MSTQSEPLRSRRSEVWGDFKAAFRGTHEEDYTEGPVGRAILLLAVPMVLETVMESVFAVVDIFFVSRIGPSAVATVALTESMLTLIYTVALGLSIGVAATVSRRIGEKNTDGAARAAVQSIVLGIAIAAVLAVLGVVFAEQLLGLMGGSEATVKEYSGYTRIMLGGNVTVLLLFLINAAFRGAGDAAIAMRVLWASNAINIVLDPTLIFGLGPFPALGIEGAAIATNIGRGTAVLMQFYLLTRGDGRLAIAARHVKILPSLRWRLVRLSGTGMFQIFISMASWIGLIRILAGFGDEVLAGYAVAIRVIIFALFPSWGMSNAAATMVGQALGAGKPERAESAVWIAGFYNMIFLGVTGAIYVVFAPTIIGWFTTDAIPLQTGVMGLRIVSAGFPFFAYGMVLTQSFNGAGDTWTPTVINLFCFWLFELPFAYALAHFLRFGPNGVFIAMALSFSMLAVVSGVVFKRGHWKTKVV